MTRSGQQLIRLVLLGAVGYALLAPATVSAQAQEGHTSEPVCVIQETGAADVPISFDEIDEVEIETGSVILCAVEEGGVGTASGAGGGVGAVGRIDAGAGATAAAGSVTALPWLLAAGAGVAGSVLRRRRR